MNFMLALNVTIYGLGIVFLALLVLMVAIMLLDKIFAMATGKDMLATGAPAAPEAPPQKSAAVAAPQPAPAPSAGVEGLEPVIAPLPGKVLSVAVQAGKRVRRGDELCVIEAMKMGNSVKAPRDAVVAEVRVAPGDTVSFGAPLVLLASTAAAARPRPAPVAAAPVAPSPAAAGPTGLTLTVAGASHTVDVAAGAGSVRLDGTSYRVERDAADGKKILVNGRPHTVEIKEMAGTSATVLIDGVPQKIEVARRAPSTPVPLSLAQGGKAHKAEVTNEGGGASTVLVNGTAYRIERDTAEPTQILVNGQPHTVEVKEMAGTSATVLIDGRTERLEIVRETVTAGTAPAPATPPGAAAPARSGQPSAGERITAPLPGKILSVAFTSGDGVRKGDELCVIEAMKMGNSIRAQRDGTVREVLVAPGQAVAFGAVLLVLE